MRFRYRVAISITTADGRVLRYGPDEPRADGVPFATTYSSTIPGGHDQATFSLRTKITDELPFTLLDDVRIYGPGNVTLWEGYVSQLPRQSGDDFLVNVQCVGHSAKLKWETGFCEIYVESDLSRWTGIGLERRLNHLSAVPAWSVSDGATGSDNALPGVNLSVQGPWPSRAISEAFHPGAAGVPIGAIYYDFSAAATTNPADANWTLQVAVGDNMFSLISQLSGDLFSASTGSGYFVAPDQLRSRVSFLQLAYNAAGGTAGTTYEVHIRKLALYGGAHGLTRVGTDPKGYYGHDILSNVVERAGSGLTPTGVEDNTSFVVPQCAFYGPVTAEEVILDVNKYYLYEWGCWGQEFFWRPADPDRLTWEARMDQGAHMNLEGDEADNTINGVIVSYSLPDGTGKTAGPIGSNQDVTDDALGDTSSSNTVNAHGILAKYAKLDVSFPTTDSGAVAMGAAYLAQLALPARKGSISLTGYVQHPTKGLRPVSEVRAGDWVRVSDSASPQIARRIVQVSHDADNRQCQLDVGNDVDKVDAILQRVGIKSSLIG